MSLKALANKVLERDTHGTNGGTQLHELSHAHKSMGQRHGTTTAVTPQNACNHQNHGNVEFLAQFTFNFHLRQLKQTHGDKLPYETLEAIAFNRTQHDWIRANLPPLNQYDEAKQDARLEHARTALIKDGLPACKRITDLTKGNKYE